MQFKELVNNLSQIINPKYIQNLHRNFILVEASNEGNTIKSQNLRIQGNITNFTYCLDSKCSMTGKSFNPFDIFNSTTPNISSKNNLTIIYPDEEKNILKVFILEMKSLNSSGAAHQIRASKNFVDYLISQHNLNFQHLPYTIEFYGILAKKPKLASKGTSTSKTRQFHFLCKEYKGYEIPTLEWNVDEILPLGRVISNMKIHKM